MASLNGGVSREQYALRENKFLGQTESKLDEYIEQGRAVLGNLVDQRSVLKVSYEN